MYCCWVSQMLTDSFFFSLCSLKLTSFPGLVPVTFFPSLSFAPELFSYLISSFWAFHSNSSHLTIAVFKRSDLTLPGQIILVCSSLFSFCILACFNDSPLLLVSNYFLHLVSVQMISSDPLSLAVFEISCPPSCLSAIKPRS